MATVWIPPLMLDLTRGEQVLEAGGETLREIIDDLEGRYPGLGRRLFRDGRLLPGIALAVDGVVSNEGRALPIRKDSEIHFLPAINGG